MKKSISITLMLIMIVSFMGCDSSASTDNKGDVTKYTTNEKTTKLVVDETLTGELTVDFLAMASDESEIQTRIEKLFEKYYPNVKLIFMEPQMNSNNEMASYTEIYTKLETELMSGRGPDVFPIGGDVIDPYKSMLAGAFVDMAPYFEADKNFNVDDFNKGVLYGAQIGGKQYAVPTRYNMPLLLTTQSIIDEIGFDISKCNDYFGISDEIARVIKENKLKLTDKQLVANLDIPHNCMNYLGTKWIDYSNKSVNIDTPEMKRTFESYKNDLLPYTKNDYSFNTKYFNNLRAARELHAKQLLFFRTEGDGFNDIIKHARALQSLSETPVLIPWRDANGGIQVQPVLQMFGVNSNCKNIPAAYAFLKVCMSEEFAEDDNPVVREQKKLNGDGLMYISVNNKTIKSILDSQIRDVNQEDELGPFKFREQLPTEFINQYMKYLDEVTGVTIDPAIKYEVNKIMQPYLDGEKSYEECMTEAKETLEIYMSE